MRRRLTGLAVATTATLALLTAVAGPTAYAAGGEGRAQLRIDGERFVDRGGATVILRGGALIRKSPPGLPEVSARDWRNMRSLGWNSIRLGTAWEYVEPARDSYDEDYLDRLAGLAREAMREGFYVVLDMHQDVWGRPVGGGAPAWAVYPECAPLHVDLATPTGSWAANYLSPWTGCQFSRFWEDRELQAHYAEAWRRVAARLGNEPRLAGYDLMNEPFQGAHPPGEFENRLLYPFYARIAAAIREVDPDALVFEEPPNSKNAHLPTSPAVLDARDRAAYAPHVYGLWDASDAFTEREVLVEANMRYSAREARAMRVPQWYGEFGMRRGVAGAEETLTQIYDRADEQLAGTSYWEYTRGSYGVLDADGNLDPGRARTLSRTYPMRTHGRLEAFSYASDDGDFRLRWRAGPRSGRTVVYVPALQYPSGYEVRADRGVTARPIRGTQLLAIRATPGAHTLAITRPR